MIPMSVFSRKSCAEFLDRYACKARELYIAMTVKVPLPTWGIYSSAASACLS